MGIGNFLDRVFAERPGDAELIGHPIRIWRSSFPSMKALWAASMTLGLTVPLACFLFLLTLQLGFPDCTRHRRLTLGRSIPPARRRDPR